MSQYEGVHHKIQPTIELQQALLMSTNFKEGAGIVNGTQITGSGPLPHSNQLTKSDKVGSAPDGGDAGASYYYKQDYLSDLSKKCQSKDFA